MFDYHSTYRRNGEGLHMKAFWFTVLMFILMSAASILFFFIMMLPVAFIDGGNTGAFAAVLLVFIMIFIFILAGIFIFYPISVGVLRYFALTYRQMDFGFKAAFRIFKRGNYSKAIKLGILVIVAYIVFGFIMGFLIQFILMAVNTPIIMLVESMAQGGQPTGGQIGLIIGIVVLNFLVVLVSYIPYLLVMIYVFLIYMTYIDQPLIPTMDKFRIAWDVMFRGGESIVKLIFSNLLLWLIPLVVYFIVIILSILLAAFVGEAAFIIGFSLGALALTVMYAIISYFMVGSIVAYYFKSRDRLDEAARVAEIY